MGLVMTADQLATEYGMSYMLKQRNILLWLARLTTEVEVKAAQGDQVSLWVLTQGGIAWEPIHPEEPRSNASSRAAMSRRVRRLAERGLVEQNKDHDRTNGLKLTPMGREVADLLTARGFHEISPMSHVEGAPCFAL
jgi:hypothetical protein